MSAITDLEARALLLGAEAAYETGYYSVDDYLKFCQRNRLPKYWEFLVVKGAMAF